jgi:sarcosine oxidase
MYDVVIVGVGGMGSAAAWHLVRRGLRVAAIEQFTPPHDRGSSHGLTRIIRLAYFEHPSYVPLLRRAFALWRELERESGERLLHVTGGIDAGPRGSRVFEGSLESCRLHGLPHEVLSAAEVNHRFPGYRLPDEMQAVFQPDAGFLEPEKCIETHVALARKRGADVLTGARVHGIRRTSGGVAVQVDGDEIRASQLVMTAGAWTPAFVPELKHLLRPERQVVGWFGIDQPGTFALGRFPVFVMATAFGTFYGFPEHDVPGFKIGKYHHRAEPVDPDWPRRAVDADDERVLRECVSTHFRGADGPLLRASTCIFTNTPDEHFIIDRHPTMPEVFVVSACSGHGFKFCSVVGEIVADLVCDGRSEHDLGLFGLDRFQGI